MEKQLLVPPMSVPHLDTRYIDGKRTLLFGPFAGFHLNFKDGFKYGFNKISETKQPYYNAIGRN